MSVSFIFVVADQLWYYFTRRGGGGGGKLFHFVGLSTSFVLTTNKQNVFRKCATLLGGGGGGEVGRVVSLISLLLLQTKKYSSEL